ncbi:MAG: ArgE/DapE family deacylase [Actinomycetota bacterium]|nr:ArgE/DapE family deacylase [Actinomycetota bacterium]
MSSRTDPGLGEALDQFIDEREDQLVGLVRDLVRFETVSVDLEPGSMHRHNQEGELQEYAAARLAALGCSIDQWEPDPASLRDHPMMPAWHHWKGRPITVATQPGAGGGRSLIINGHIDVVSPGDPEAWQTPPFAAEVRDGRIYGRGAVDMKGGVAAAIFALEALEANGVRLAGDVIFEVVPDEETCAMGTVAAIERGYRADAGLVPEPTRLDLWVATRGLLHGSLRVPGRSAHAEMNQPPWEQGGGVNAIERALPLLAAIGELRDEWAVRPDKSHPLLGNPQVQPTVIEGGTFISNVPESCEVKLNATYLPGDADADGYGSAPRDEIVGSVAAAAERDPWLRSCPVKWSWATDYPPSEIDLDAEILSTVREATAPLGLEPRAVGIDTTYDGALLTRLAGVASPAFGPGDLSRAHAPNEWIGIEELKLGARAYGHAIVAWCGTSE